MIEIGINGPIGMLDSGVGGLAIAKEVISCLPSEQLIYVGDTRFFPYGTKQTVEVLTRVRAILDFFNVECVKVAVLACNTASAVALPGVRAEYPFPIVGVIEAGAKMAVARSRSGRIGVLATERTVESGAYSHVVAGIAPEVRVFGQPAPELVGMVEAGFSENEIGDVDRSIIEHVTPLIDEGIDTLILGCTHFLALQENVSRLFPGLIVIDPAAETAREVASIFDASHPHCLFEEHGRHRFFISGGDYGHFREVGSRILGREIAEVKPFNPIGVLKINQ